MSSILGPGDKWMHMDGYSVNNNETWKYCKDVIIRIYGNVIIHTKVLHFDVVYLMLRCNYM